MSSSPVVANNNRRAQRISLALPIRVETQVDASVSWSEITRLSDVSAFGAGFNLKRPIKRGRLILLTMPLPRQLRCYDFMEAQYKIWGLVRRCVPVGNFADGEDYAHGVAFIGKNPPASFAENPARLYDLESDHAEEGLWSVAEATPYLDEKKLPKEQRRQTRFPIPENITVEVLDADGNVTGRETTVTENLSLGGASVFTTLDAVVGSFLRVTSERQQTEIISVVRGRRIAPDGISRLHIEFIDHFFPLEGVD